MAWRDSRRSRSQLLLYSICIVLGVAALIAIGSFGENMAESIEGQAKTLLGADLVLSSHDDLSRAAIAFIRSIGGSQAREISFSSMVYFRKQDHARLVQIRALEGGFPFYGTLETSPPNALTEFRAQSGILIEDGLMKQFAVNIGDPVGIGEASFSVLGSLQKIPGESVAFGSIAARVFLPFNLLMQTGLLKKGSLVRHRTYIAFFRPVDVPFLVRKLQPQLDQFHLEADTVEHRKHELGRAMTNLYHFLNLVGFIALLLGGIGIASAIHVHVKQKLPTVAILRSLGCTSTQAFVVYLAQAIGLAGTGVLLGAALGLAVQLGLPALLGDFLPIRFTPAVSFLAVARGIAIGFILCLLFASLPLLEVRRISPLAVLRWSYEDRALLRPDPLVWVCYGLIAVCLLGFSISQSQHWHFGVAFAVGLGAAFALLAGVAKAIVWGLRGRVGKLRPFTLRQGLANLFRPNNRTVLLMLSLGLGTFLILSLQLVEMNLVGQLFPTEQKERADAVLFDIQSDQVQGVTQILQAQQLPVLQEVPVVTMRLASVQGRPVDQIRKEGKASTPKWALNREYRSTYRERLVDSEKIIAGVWHPRVPSDTSPVPISLEDGIAKTLRVGLGDSLIFDVQGVPIKTVVASLREVEWRRLQPNFFVLFPVGVLEDAPSFHVLVTRVGSSERSANLQRAISRQFPNVSTIDLTLVLQTVDAILSKISFVLRFMAVFTVGTGLFVLVATILAGRYQRLQECVLLRILGATRGQLRQILFIEYIALGTLAALTGIILAVGASWALARFVFHLTYNISIWPLLYSVVIVSVLTVITGLFAARGVCERPPLEVLRSEG